MDQAPATKPQKKHAKEKSITVWIPRELAGELDARLAKQVAGQPGIRPSRQGFVVAAIRRALDAQPCAAS